MNKILTTALFLLLFTTIYAQEPNTEPITNTVIEKGIGLGNVIAVAISWSKNKSILYAILHGIFGWLYVIYTAIKDWGKK